MLQRCCCASRSLQPPTCSSQRGTSAQMHWHQDSLAFTVVLFQVMRRSLGHLACRLQQRVDGVQVHDQGALPADPGPPHAQPQLRAAAQLANCKVAQAAARTPQALRRYPGSSQSDSGKEGSL